MVCIPINTLQKLPPMNETAWDTLGKIIFLSEKIESTRKHRTERTARRLWHQGISNVDFLTGESFQRHLNPFDLNCGRTKVPFGQWVRSLTWVCWCGSLEQQKEHRKIFLLCPLCSKRKIVYHFNQNHRNLLVVCYWILNALSYTYLQWKL